jgi:hypothetical protein
MNHLSRDKQIEVISALCDGLGVRAAARIFAGRQAVRDKLAVMAAPHGTSVKATHTLPAIQSAMRAMHSSLV